MHMCEAVSSERSASRGPFHFNGRLLWIRHSPILFVGRAARILRAAEVNSRGEDTAAGSTWPAARRSELVIPVDSDGHDVKTHSCM